GVAAQDVEAAEERARARSQAELEVILVHGVARAERDVVRAYVGAPADLDVGLAGNRVAGVAAGAGERAEGERVLLHVGSLIVRGNERHAIGSDRSAVVDAR